MWLGLSTDARAAAQIIGPACTYLYCIDMKLNALLSQLRARDRKRFRIATRPLMDESAVPNGLNRMTLYIRRGNLTRRFPSHSRRATADVMYGPGVPRSSTRQRSSIERSTLPLSLCAACCKRSALASACGHPQERLRMRRVASLTC